MHDRPLVLGLVLVLVVLVVLVVLGMVIPIEAIAAAEILHAWFPQIPSALYAFAFIILLSSANFLVPKVLVSFILIGTLAVFGLWPLTKDVSGAANLYANGAGSVLAAILITAFFLGRTFIHCC